MKLIKPQYQIITQESGLEGLYKQIELCGRVAYKSEDKITKDSYKEFVDRMIKLNHGAVLEHGTVYLYCKSTGNSNPLNKYFHNKYSKAIWIERGGYADVCITTNLRLLIENNWLNDLQYLCEPTEHHEKRACVRFICDRGISHEFVRHRTFSFLMESTRYCNYSKDKFDNELTFIQPCWLDDKKLKLYGPYHTIIRDKSPESIFITNLNNIERDYLDLISFGWKPQEARTVLPNSLKTELIMTGFISDWKHFFKLRCAGSAHPQAKELAIPLHREFLNRGYL